MNIALWVVQILLAVTFAGAGFMKLSTPADQLAAAMPWVGRVPSWAPYVAGAAEVLGSLGLVLPAATRIRPVLTPLAALGLVMVMLLAVLWVHLPAGDPIGANLALALVAGLVAYGRLKVAPIEPRN